MIWDGSTFYSHNVHKDIEYLYSTMKLVNVKQPTSKNEIFEYVRRSRKSGPVGVILALRDEQGKVWVGWSKASISKGDTFDSQRGLEMARSRALKQSNALIPASMEQEVEHMMDRAARYFRIPFEEVLVAGSWSDGVSPLNTNPCNEIGNL